MDTSNIDNLVEWIFDNKEIFNSKQYIDLMSLVQKLVVDILGTNEKKEDYATLMQLNNYRLQDSDSEAEDEDASNDNLLMLRSSDAESDEEEEDFATYTGRYINSY